MGCIMWWSRKVTKTKSFKVGDKVKIKKRHFFYDQAPGIEGICDGPTITHDNKWIHVKFNNGYSNSYPFKALEKIEHDWDE